MDVNLYRVELRNGSDAHIVYVVADSLTQVLSVIKKTEYYSSHTVNLVAFLGEAFIHPDAVISSDRSAWHRRIRVGQEDG